MNANELADHMEKYFDSEPYCDEVVAMLRQQQAEIEALKKEKWLTEIDAKQQALKKIIDWLILEHDTLACTSYPIRKAKEK
jgi:hypothetical protein